MSLFLPIRLQCWFGLDSYSSAPVYQCVFVSLYFRLQCFKSAWIATVLHEGFHFPDDYSHFQSVQLINGKDVQWTLGALVYKTRFFPLRSVNHGFYYSESYYRDCRLYS